MDLDVDGVRSDSRPPAAFAPAVLGPIHELDAIIQSVVLVFVFGAVGVAYAYTGAVRTAIGWFLLVPPAALLAIGLRGRPIAIAAFVVFLIAGLGLILVNRLPPARRPNDAR